MVESTVLEVHTVLNPPINLKEISCNCPRCDYEINIEAMVDDNSSFKCENCDHKILMKIKKI